MANSQFTIYRSTDVGAPELITQTGSLINVFKACLVDGYGSQPAAGWTASFSQSVSNTSSIMIFRQGSPQSTGLQYYCRIRNDAGGTGGFREAQIRGYESMTDYAVTSGTYAFPSADLISNTDNSLLIRYSNVFTSTPIPWIMAADNRTFYLFVSSGSGYAQTSGFGDFYANNQNDIYRCFLIANQIENSSLASNYGLDSQGSLTLGANTNGRFISKNSVGTGPSSRFVMVGGPNPLRGTALSSMLSGSFAFPNPTDGKIYLSPLLVFTTGSQDCIRGKMRGFWHFLHPGSSVSTDDTFSGGTGDLSGRDFLIIAGGMRGGVFTIETSNTVETN